MEARVSVFSGLIQFLKFQKRDEVAQVLIFFLEFSITILLMSNGCWLINLKMTMQTNFCHTCSSDCTSSEDWMWIIIDVCRCERWGHSGSKMCQRSRSCSRWTKCLGARKKKRNLSWDMKEPRCSNANYKWNKAKLQPNQWFWRHHRVCYYLLILKNGSGDMEERHNENRTPHTFTIIN